MTGKNIPTVAETILKGIIVLLGLYFILSYLFMVSKRLFYPFELEWLEGYFISAVLRVLHNKPIYPAPNHEFVPFLYPPLYYWLNGGLAKIFGVTGFVTARLVSVSASFLSSLIIYKFIYRETGNKFCSFTGIALFLACYGLSDFWYDVARVDSLFLALSLWGLYLMRFFAGSTVGPVFSALLLSMAYYTKQSALFFIIICSLYFWSLDKKKFIGFIAVCFVLILCGNLLINLVTDGWYRFYSFDVPLKHYSFSQPANNMALAEIYSQYTPFARQDYSSLKKLYLFFTTDLLANIPFVLSFILGWLLYWIKSPEKKDITFFYTLALTAAMLASISMRCKLGGHVNGIIPTVAVAILFFGIVAGHIIKAAKGNSILLYLLYFSIFLQFIMLKYNPLNHIPTSADYIAGNRLIETVSSFKGDVFIPFHSYYPAMAGKEMFVHKMPFEDVLIGFPERFPQTLREKIEKRQFAAIIYDWEIRPDTVNPLEQEIIGKYIKADEITYRTSKTFMPLSGLKVRPRFVYVPRQEEQDGERAGP